MSVDLERCLRDNDKEALSVYADELIEKGDPRGELIQVQLRLEEEGLSPEQRAGLTKREKELLDAHAATWLGPLAEPLSGDRDDSTWAYRRHKFERGFLHTIDTYSLDVALVRGLRHSKETRFLQRLLLQSTEYIEEEVELDGEQLGEDSALASMLPFEKLVNLRELQIGPIDDDNTHVQGEDIPARIAELRNLEVLALGALHVETETVFGADLPKLKKLLVYHVYHYDLATLANNPSMANLEELGCRPHGLEPGDDDAYIQLADVEALARSPHLKKLRCLELRASDMGDEGVAVLIESGLLSRLEVLDLHYGAITDAGAKLLANHPATKKLRKLDIGGNALTQAGLKLLADAGIAYVSDQQFQLNDEREYLWYGCPE